jgi:hypothetical protein
MNSDARPGGPTAWPKRIVIPYGIELSPPGDMGDWEGSTSLAFPCEVIDTRAGVALRLNNSRYHFDAAGSRAGPGTEPFEAIRQHLIGLCGPWSGLPQRFLGYYFGEVESIIEEAREDLLRRLMPYEGLFTHRDWRFSAPKPLPRAFLPLPDSEASPPATAATFVRVELAFWLGDRLLVMQSEPSPLTPRAATEQAARLTRAGIAVVTYGAADLVPGNRALIARILGERRPAFWSGEVLPAGPFRPAVAMPV